MKVTKTFDFEIVEKSADGNGGRIRISTPDLDRDRDRVIPVGGRIENYMRNPVVQWGHGYSEPWQTVGRTTALEITPEGITASFELRPAANEQDPQNIVRLLWEGGWIKAASIGFIPKGAKPNAEGGNDFGEWELLEWSLVPIPANQAALTMAAKALDDDAPRIEAAVEKAEAALDEAVTKGEPWAAAFVEHIESKRGRVLSRSNESKLRTAHEAIGEVLAQLQSDEPPADEPASDEPVQEQSPAPEAKAEEPPALSIDEEMELEIAARLSDAVKYMQEIWK